MNVLVAAALIITAIALVFALAVMAYIHIMWRGPLFNPGRATPMRFKWGPWQVRTEGDPRCSHLWGSYNNGGGCWVEPDGTLTDGRKCTLCGRIETSAKFYESGEHVR